MFMRGAAALQLGPDRPMERCGSKRGPKKDQFHVIMGPLLSRDSQIDLFAT